MSRLLPKTGTSWVKSATLAAAAYVATLLASAGSARGELAEEALQSGLDSTATHLFPMNPAVHRIEAAQAGILVERNSKETRLEQSSNNETIVSETNDDYAAFGALFDLGAGAGIGVTHQTLYRKTETQLESQARAVPKLESMKQQHSTLKLVVELTDQLRAGMAIRYLYKDISVYGDPFLGVDETTNYKTTLVGYGGGFAYYFDKAGLAYTYYPPLRGKSEIYGEEMIIVEPGQIAVDGYFAPNSEWTVGVLGKRWLNELDDRATGTTAADNETNISLYGLDPDQYLFQQRLVMIGAEYQVSKQAGFKASLGQEEAELNFEDLLLYDRVDVRERRADEHETLKYYRLRGMVSYKNAGIELDGGMGLFTRKHELPSSMNGAKYQSEGRELFATISMKL